MRAVLRLVFVFCASVSGWSSLAAHADFLNAQALLQVAGTLESPPPPESLAGLADLEAVLTMQRMRSPMLAAAVADDHQRDAVAWATHAIGRPDALVSDAAADVFERARSGMTWIIDHVKSTGPQRLRPHQLEPRVTPSLPVDTHQSSSWPSARAAATMVWSGILSDLFPRCAARLDQAADWSAKMRIVGGVHFPSDVVAGVRLADRYLARLRQTEDYKLSVAQVRDYTACAAAQGL